MKIDYLYKKIKMKIALIQSHLFWENPGENRNYFENKIRAIDGKVDLIVLPEMFSTGFTMNPYHLAETMQGKTISWLKNLALEIESAITGSLIIEENGKYFNRLVFVFPDQKVEFYNKRHLFSLAKEQKAYTPGKEKLIVNYKGWKICPLICYDLRFPVFSRNQENYDLLIYVANWPTPRIEAWKSLLKARAIENMVYTIGVNRIGEDGNKHFYPGQSQILDYLGNEMIETSAVEEVFIVKIDINEQLKARRKFGFLKDQDSFSVYGSKEEKV